QAPQRAQTQHIPRRLRIPGMEDVLVKHWVDISGAALQKESHGAVSEGVLDHSGGETGEIRRGPAVWNPLDGMACKIVDDCQGPSVRLVQTQYADFRIYWSHRNHLLVGNKRIGVTDIRILAVFEFQPTVFHDPILVAGSGADS